jgi:hypothetical protein
VGRVDVSIDLVGRVDVSIDAARHLTNKNEDRRTKSKKSNFKRRISQCHDRKSSRKIIASAILTHAEPVVGMVNNGDSQ